MAVTNLVPVRIAVRPVGIPGVPGAPGLDYESVAQATAATIPGTKVNVRIGGWTSTVKGGDAIYAVVASEPSHGMKFKDAGGRWWTFAGDRLSVLQAGATDSDADADRAANTAAFTRALSYLASLTRGRLILPNRGTGRYRLANGSTTLFLDNVLIDADEGVRLAGNVQLGLNARVTREVFIDYDAGIGQGSTVGPAAYTDRKSPMHGRPPAEKGLWLTEALLPRQAIRNLDASVLNNREIVWPGSDTWAADSALDSANTNSDSVVRDISNDGKMHMSWVPIRGGQRLNVAFTDFDGFRVAGVRTTAGYFLFYSNSTGPATYAYKRPGQSAVVTGGVDWASRDVMLSRQPRYARWSIRVYDYRRWSVLLNGEEVIQPQDIAQGEILEAGFGIFGNASLTDAGVQGWTVITEREAAGKAGMKIRVEGDSTAAPIFGALTNALKDAIDGSPGVRVIGLTNTAVAGNNTGQVATRITQNGVDGANYCILKVGRNDVQQGAPLATSISNLSGTIDYLLSVFCMPVLCIPGQWYSQAQAGGGGTFTQNYERGALLRTEMLRLAAIKGVLFYEEEAVQGPILPSYLGQPDVIEPRLRDNIHQTDTLYRLDGYGIARVILDHFLRPMTMRVPEAPLVNVVGENFGPQNGWSSANANYRVSGEGMVTLGGFLNTPTTTVTGQVAHKLPPNIRPKSTKRIAARTSLTTPVWLDIQVDGNVVCQTMANGATFAVLDGISYEAA